MRCTRSGKAVNILLVEDNAGDVRLMLEAFKDRGPASNLSVVNNGFEAMEFLQRHGIYTCAPRPDLILLDLNMPRMDGREVLTLIKEDSDLVTIPVIVFTTSQTRQDVIKSYELHANCFITKPADLDRFYEVIDSILEFWFGVVELPWG